MIHNTTVEHITLSNSYIFTESAETATELLQIMKAKGYKRSITSDFNSDYVEAYASTAPTEKRLVQVRYAPENNAPIHTPDLLVMLLSSGFKFHDDLGANMYLLMREIVEEEVVEVVEETVIEDVVEATDTLT